MKEFFKAVWASIVANILFYLVPTAIASISVLLFKINISPLSKSVYFFIFIFSMTIIVMKLLTLFLIKTDDNLKILKKLYKNNNDEYTFLYLFIKEDDCHMPCSNYTEDNIVRKLIKRHIVNVDNWDYEFNRHVPEYYKIKIEFFDALKRHFKKRSKLNEEVLNKYKELPF